MTSSPPLLFLSVGERSGDLHGASLLRALRAQTRGNVRFIGVPGPEMRKEGMLPLLPMEHFEVMGFTDVFWALPRLVNNFYRMKRSILEKNPAAVILIDSPTLHLRLANALRQSGYTGKIIQYICPSVWAWGKTRIPRMADTLDLLLTIYPFEQSYFATTPLDVRYVGNPVEEEIRHHRYKDDWKKELSVDSKTNFSSCLGISPTQGNLISLFPGSRIGEIQRNLPKQLAVASLYHAQYPETLFALSYAHESVIPIITQIIQKCSLKHHIFLVPAIYRYEMMRDSRLAIAKSGTVTLELALHHCPSIVTYALTPLNHFIAKYFLRLNLPYYCIVNILGEQEIFPEFIGKEATIDTLLNTVISLDKDSTKRSFCLQQCSRISSLLQGKAPSNTAAQAILNKIGLPC